jgi:hypothetical protein
LAGFLHSLGATGAHFAIAGEKGHGVEG